MNWKYRLTFDFNLAFGYRQGCLYIYIVFYNKCWFFEIFVSLWLNECDGCVTLQDPNFVTVSTKHVLRQHPYVF